MLHNVDPDKVSHAAAHATAGGLFVGGSLSLNDWLAITGVCISAATAVAHIFISIYFNRKRLKMLEQRKEVQV